MEVEQESDEKKSASPWRCFMRNPSRLVQVGTPIIGAQESEVKRFQGTYSDKNR